jgi:nucleoside-diphosphate-sugar epimerase
MKIFVTGGTGFLGRRVVKALCEDGLRVRCLVRPSSDVSALRDFVGPDHWPTVEVVAGELSDVDSCRKLIDDCDTVAHVAAALGGSTAVMFLNTVIPTRHLLAAAAQAGVRRFVQVSSFGVYGAAGLSTGTLLNESTPLDPHPELRDPYSYSKIVQEQVAWEARAQTNLPLVIIRPGVIFGPGRGVLSGRVGLSVGPLLVRMGGSQTLPYTYVDNCAAAIRQAVIAEGIDGEAFNILDDGLPTGSQLVRKMRRAGKKVRSLWVPRPLIGPLSSVYEWYSRWSQGQLPGVITRYRSDSMWKKLKYSNEKAKTQLGWRPHVTFDEAFERSLAEGRA